MRLIRRTALCLALSLTLLAWPLAACAGEVEGFSEPYRDIDIAAAETGLLESMEVKEGDRVTPGQVLARLDDSLLKATVAIAKSTMEAGGRLELAEAEVALQSDILARVKELSERNHASRQEIERAETQLRIAAARLQTVRDENAIRALEYERAHLQLEQRRLISPIAGVVIRIFKDRGEFVSMSDPAVIKVVQLDPLLVVFSVPAESARELAVGQAVQVRIAEVEKPVEGEVEFVSPTADPQSSTTRVRVRLPNPQEQLPCGVTCRLLLPGVLRSTAEAAGP